MYRHKISIEEFERDILPFKHPRYVESCKASPLAMKVAYFDWQYTVINNTIKRLQEDKAIAKREKERALNQYMKEKEVKIT